jgi:predicted lipid-binding transport protein (Tim44 family)
MKNRFMNKLFVSLFAVIAAVALIAGAPNAEAKRMGGGKSVGKSSQTATPANGASNASSAPAAAPAAAKTAAPAAPAAAPASNRSKWLGPLAGLAAGLGLAALASHLGFGEGFGNIMMILLFAMIAFAAFKFFMSRRAASAGNAPSGLTSSYAGAGNMGGNTNYQASAPAALQPASSPSSGYTGGIGSGIAPIGGAALEAIPGFDETAFVRQAKVYFVRLQAAYDAADQKDLREFTSPEMFGELMMEINERNGAANRTETVKLDSEFMGQGASADLQHASVRFFGTVKEFEGTQTHAEPHDINETWNFAKPTNGVEGWTLVGIEQN